MATDLDSSKRTSPRPPADFAARLESALARADRDRRRLILLRRLRAGLTVLLLIGPIAGWRLMLVSPDGFHVGVAALAWTSAVIDVAVHLDTAILAYLRLQVLPAIVGFLLFVLVTVTLLSTARDEP